MIVWGCTEWKKFISLDKLCQFLEVGSKSGDGAAFYRLWKDDRQAAIQYLAGDVVLPSLCAERMGIIRSTKTEQTVQKAA